MDSAFKLISLILVSLAFALQSQNSHSYQNLAIAAGEPDFFRNPVTNFNSARFSANDPIYDPGSRTVTTTRPYNVTGLDGKVYQATITKTAAADIPKVGAALSKFAQRVGPLSMAFATADLICTLSSICKNTDNQFEIAGTDPYPGFPNSYPLASGQWWGWGSSYYPDPQSACGDSARLTVNVGSGFVFDHVTQIDATTYQCFARRLSDGAVFAASNTVQSVGCASHYTVSGSNCLKTGLTDKRSPTSSDWTSAETALSTPAAADRLAAELEPLPIQVPSVFAPISVPLGTATTTNKDALGNATGTQQTTRRMDIEDAATEAEPYRVTVKETETVTNYDLNNSPISSTETVKQSDTPAEPPPPEDIEIDFDESVDRDLQTFEVPGLFSYTPFGGAGSCPADVTENTKFGNVTMSYAPVCRVAEGVKPFVILLAIISAFFIVSGSRQS